MKHATLLELEQRYGMEKKKKWVLILFIGMKIENIVYVWNGKEEKKFFGMLGEMWMRWL